MEDNSCRVETKAEPAADPNIEHEAQPTEHNRVKVPTTEHEPGEFQTTEHEPRKAPLTEHEPELATNTQKYDAKNSAKQGTEAKIHIDNQATHISVTKTPEASKIKTSSRVDNRKSPGVKPAIPRKPEHLKSRYLGTTAGSPVISNTLPRTATSPTDASKTFSAGAIAEKEKSEEQAQTTAHALLQQESAMSSDDDVSTNHDSDMLKEPDDSHLAKPHEYRIVLVGRSGEGKSATANTIFGHRVFYSSASAASVTAECSSHKDTIEGRELLVVDTPGIFDTSKSNAEIKSVILKFIGITSPGPHIILLVMRIGRFTKEVGETYEHVRDLLGNDSHQFTILVLTGRDDLENEDKKVEDYLKEAPNGLKQILVDTAHRYVVFNNRANKEDKISQVSALLRQIDDVIKINQGGWYQSAAYEASESALQEKEQEKRDPIIEQTNEEKIKFEAELEETQSHIDKIKKNAKDETLKRANRSLLEAERNHEAKMKTLLADCETRLLKVRDGTRKEIHDNKLNVSQPWFTKKFKGAGKKLKEIIGV